MQMLVSLLLTTMASSGQEGAGSFAHSTCRHFALLFASGWGQQLPPALPPSSKYGSYPVLDGVPAKVTALKHLHPQAVLEAFQEVRVCGCVGWLAGGWLGGWVGGWHVACGCVHAEVLRGCC